MLLVKKAMTNLDRDITLPTKVHIVKDMLFPVVIYECESWILKKKKNRLNTEELMLSNCAVGENS